MESNKSKTTKHCAYGTCNSDSRYGDRTEMKNVFFLRFPQPGKDLEKCARWVKACSRVGFDVSRVKKDTYICCKHFVGGKGPTDNHPDPIPANATKYDVSSIDPPPPSPTYPWPISTTMIHQDIERKVWLQPLGSAFFFSYKNTT